MHHIVLSKFVVILEEGRAYLLASLGPDAAEAEGQDKFSVTGVEIDLSRARDVAVFRALVFPFHLEVLGKVLPSVRRTHESDGHLFPRRRGGQRQRCAVMLGEKHGQPFIIADPTGVGVTAIFQVRREQRVKAIVGKLPLERFKANLLQHHVTVGVGENFLTDAVAAAVLGINQFKRGNARLEGPVLKRAVPLLLGKKASTVGDEEAEISSASLVDSRVVDFTQKSMTQGEPNRAVLVQGRARASLRARGPARWNPRPAGGEERRGI